MTVTKGLAVALTLAVAGALAHAGTPAAASVRLKAISSRVDAKGAALVIETSEPVPYVATRPDPLTVLLEFRNVDAQSVTRKLASGARNPIAEVTIDNGEALGDPVSTVRIALNEPVMHRVRSERSSVIVEFEQQNGKSVPYVLPPASTREATDVSATGGAADPIAALNLQALVSSRPAAASAQAVAAPAAAQAQTPAPAGTPSTAVPGQREYTGFPINLNFEDADLKAVLRAFADQTGLNLLIDDAVRGTVNVQLTAVPWDQALDLILRANKIGYIIDGTVVRIAPLAVLSDEEAQRRKLAEEQALSGELRIMPRTLSYAKAEDLQALLTKSVLSSRGTVQVDARTNTLIISDLQARLDAATSLIGTLDKPQPQVEIEARIVQANKNYARAIGVQWGFQGAMTPALGNTTPLAFPNSVVVGGNATPGASGPGQDASRAVNLGAPAATSAVNLALGSVNGAFNLDVALSAAETSGQLRILSTPRVSTQNNGEAEIKQGIQIPIQVVSNNTTTVTFKDAALILRVTPQITSAGTVIMKIVLENSQADFSRAVNGIPPINTQAANTQVLVSDGQTTVIGGIYASTEQTLNDRTPGLSRLPFLNWLFKRDTVNDQSQELLIFITPRILKG